MKRIYVDMDDTLCDYKMAFKEAILHNPSNQFPQSTYGFFTSLKPLDNSIEVFNWLNNYFDVWIATRPSYKNPLCYIEKRVWVEEYLGLDACNKLIIIPDKNLLKGEYLIDDTTHWSGFEGKHIHYGSKEFPNWGNIYEYFEKII